MVFPVQWCSIKTSVQLLTGPGLADAKPKTNPLVRSPLPLLRVGEIEKC